MARRRRKACHLCESKISVVDYKDEQLLSRFVTERGKIVPSRITGTCAPHQRQLTRAIKRGRYLALIPYVEGYRH
ncbi:MAG: 30S ribosomal protein S18 [Gemmatimonadetes bacterium]|uniref:Small ribosomal subunit protein bS18 n=1 Tax=Candidatus Kutchimonas denitrificans TaxID=3056748 RepID=A0AAE4Z8L0_9BACT|nr:30S ribosomal protein S18 [Gemmatimonadota bacterium]NIR74998.1 30S ribosomal protein S18 [Candidatus Kutchimonas denitrificans]NIS01581.1 30S ribosomal protein S18 [Gemmatimonadota bacterium]NIT67319.1 30S ribosomal protein S18 [Gemmatimonadota bacterium]NIU52682.1 30S ribosomal protein S18 [Gemmatimonadota bacterium]